MIADLQTYARLMDKFRESVDMASSTEGAKRQRVHTGADVISQEVFSVNKRYRELLAKLHDRLLLLKQLHQLAGIPFEVTLSLI